MADAGSSHYLWGWDRIKFGSRCPSFIPGAESHIPLERAWLCDPLCQSSGVGYCDPRGWWNLLGSPHQHPQEPIGPHWATHRGLLLLHRSGYLPDWLGSTCKGSHTRWREPPEAAACCWPVSSQESAGKNTSSWKVLPCVPPLQPPTKLGLTAAGKERRFPHPGPGSGRKEWGEDWALRGRVVTTGTVFKSEDSCLPLALGSFLKLFLW